MSDRTKLYDVPLRHDGKSLQLFMDGDTGTWRLFIGPEHYCADLTLSELRGLTDALLLVLAQIDEYPNTYNAEIRAEAD